jgi:hypothetical protein
MKIAHYIGNHDKDTPLVRAGWALTRLVQKGEFAHVTHCEAILVEHPDGTVDIGSSSLRDGGVRVKRNVRLTAGNWIIMNVPQFCALRSADWFARHDGSGYDTRGAFASAFPIQWSVDGRFFCNQAVGAAVGLSSPEIFGPAQFAAICKTLEVLQ